MSSSQVVSVRDVNSEPTKSQPSSTPNTLCPMDFWGVIVKAGETLPVSPDANIHISQVSMGIEDMIPDQDVTVYIITKDEGEEGEENRFRLAQLFFSPMYSVLSQKCDVYLSKDFKLSHDASGPVHIIGYTADKPVDAILEGKIYVQEEVQEAESVSVTREVKRVKREDKRVKREEKRVKTQESPEERKDKGKNTNLDKKKSRKETKKENS